MNVYQPYDSTSEAVCDVDENLGGNLDGDPMVIARLPDIDGNHDRKKNKPSPAAAISAFPRRWPILSKKVIAATGVAVLLVVCWLIFAGSDSDPESWRPAPPAASAPETPPWNSEAEPKAVIASKVSRPNATSIKLDEVLPRSPATKKQTKKSAPVQLPQATSNRPLVIGTPIPPQNVTANNRDWATLSDSEYYWAVRRRSDAEAYRTAVKPNSGLSSQYPADGRPSGPAAAPPRSGKARLNGVIETPTVRVY